MKNFKYTWIFVLILLLCGLSADSYAQRRSGGGSFGGGGRSYSSPAPTSRPFSPSIAPSQMRSGGSMGSGISSGSSSKMKSGGVMNSTPATVNSPSRPSGINNPSTGSNNSYRYKSYSGPRQTTYNGRQVYVNVNGGYSYVQGGPVIAYMPGYTPVAYAPTYSPGYGYNPVVYSPFNFWPVFWGAVIVIIVVMGFNAIFNSRN